MRFQWLAALLAGPPERLASAHGLEYSPPTNVRGPILHLPRMRAAPNREDHHLGATDQILKWHVADLAENAAVGRIVAIVAHHEVVPGRHLVDRGVVVEAVLDQLERGVAHSVGQCLAPALDAHGRAAFVGVDIVLDALALDRNAVD